jgi:hypothetical protein
MLLTDLFGAGKVGDGAGDFEDAGIGAGGEAETVGDQFQQAVADRSWFYACRLGVYGGVLQGAEF